MMRIVIDACGGVGEMQAHTAGGWTRGQTGDTSTDHWSLVRVLQAHTEKSPGFEFIIGAMVYRSASPWWAMIPVPQSLM